MSSDRLIYRFECDVDLTSRRLNNPFDYLPDSSVVAASKCVVARLEDVARGDGALLDELSRGKMLGVLVVRTSEGEEGYLAAFSGSIAGRTQMEGFVPPIYDLDCEGGYFRECEARISQLGVDIKAAECDEGYHAAEVRYREAMEAMEAAMAAAKRLYSEAKQRRAKEPRSAQSIAESQHQRGELRRLEASLRCDVDMCGGEVARYKGAISAMKSQRRELSNALQQRLFESYKVLNGRGELTSLFDIFTKGYDRLPPAGAGECAAPKLLHYALSRGYTPLSLGEFWMGESPRGEVRRAGEFYGACRGKCYPILTYMLQGLDVAPVEGSLQRDGEVADELQIIYEDDDIVAFNKPSGMLSVRGRIDAPSVESYVNERYEGAMMLHRLDQDTSGVLLVAKRREVHRLLQRQLSKREMEKRYIAIVEGDIATPAGSIMLPMRPDPLDRPRQVVDHEGGRAATTHFEVLDRAVDRGTTRLALYPHTGRTHQLRLHCAHKEGLAAPILGDRLYGRGVASAPRLMLHAERITFTHPTSGERLTLHCEATF